MSSTDPVGVGVESDLPPSAADQGLSPRRRFFLLVFYLSQLGIFLGVIAGLVWGFLSPRSQITGVEGGKVSFDPMSSAPIGADMTFMLISFLCALILVFVVYKFAFGRPLAALFGVLIGSALGTLAMFLIGSLVANTGSLDPTQLAVGETANVPLEIEATGVFYIWTFWAAILVALLCWGRSRSLAKEIKRMSVQSPAIPTVMVSGEALGGSAQE